MALSTLRKNNLLAPLKERKVYHLEHYQTSGLRSSGNQLGDDRRPLSALPGVGGEPLVNTFISQQEKKRKNPVKSFHVWPRAVKLERDYRKDSTAPPPSLRGDIQSFSASSRRRLKFTSSNAFPELISQFGMTYHNLCPDGRTVKGHLNAFLTSLRREFPSVRYLWILEFQKRGTAHFHLFLTLSHETPHLHRFMADKWHEIADPTSPEHKRFHRHASNFIPWDMGSGSYLCKYLDKEAQKALPDGFSGVGRFWGNSRGLVPEALEITTEDIDAAYSYEVIDTDTGEVLDFIASEYLTRQLCRHHEKSLRRSRWKSSARKRPTSYTLPNGSAVYRQLENYLYRQPRPENVPF